MALEATTAFSVYITRTSVNSATDLHCYYWRSRFRLTVGHDVVVVVVVCIRSHNWSARQRHHRLQSVVWTSHRVVLSVGRIRQCVTSFGSHRRNTDRSLKVSISSYRHRSDLVRCGNGSGETTVVKEKQSLVVGLWGRPRGVHWPPRPTSRILSIDCWCQLVLTDHSKLYQLLPFVRRWMWALLTADHEPLSQHVSINEC